jgi:hypothetical protein
MELSIENILYMHAVLKPHKNKIISSFKRVNTALSNDCVKVAVLGLFYRLYFCAYLQVYPLTSIKDFAR